MTLDKALVLHEHEGQPYALESNISRCLGYADPHDIRQVIDRNREEIERFGILPQIEGELKPRGKRGRRPRVYLLTEEQTTLVAMFARTPKAADVRHEIVCVFTAWRWGYLAPVRPMSKRLSSRR